MSSSTILSSIVIDANGGIDGAMENQDFTSLFRLALDQLTDTSAPPERLTRPLEGTVRLVRSLACRDPRYAGKLKELKELVTELWRDDSPTEQDRHGDYSHHGVELVATASKPVTKRLADRGESLTPSRKRAWSGETDVRTAKRTESSSSKRRKLSYDGKYCVPKARPEATSASGVTAHDQEDSLTVEELTDMFSCLGGMKFEFGYQWA